MSDCYPCAGSGLMQPAVLLDSDDNEVRLSAYQISHMQHVLCVYCGGTGIEQRSKYDMVV